MNRWRELKQRRERFELLQEWYGTEFAETEITAYTSSPRPLSAALDEILDKMNAPETGKFIRVEKAWSQIAGPEFSRYTQPAALLDGVLMLEVPHSALIAELAPSLDLIRKRIDAELGTDFCRELRLVISGGRKNNRRGSR